MRRPTVFVLCCLLAGCAADTAPPSDPPPGASDPTSIDAPTETEVPGQAPSSSEVEERLARAVLATTAAGTARTTFSATLAGLPGHAEPVTLTGTGEADFATGRLRSLIDLSAALERRSPEVDPSWETISVDEVVYLRAPMLTELFEIATPWVRVDPSSELLGAAGGLQGLAGSDNGAPLAMLAGVEPGSARDLGPAEVAGTAGRHLQASVDLVAAVEAVAADQPEPQRRALERFVEKLGARRLSVDAFLDGDDRIRGLVYEHALPAAAGGGSQRVELGYADFGARVSIDPPPSSLVTDLAGALGPGTGLGTGSPSG